MEQRSFKRLLRRTVAVPVILLMLLAAISSVGRPSGLLIQVQLIVRLATGHTIHVACNRAGQVKHFPEKYKQLFLKIAPNIARSLA